MIFNSISGLLFSITIIQILLYYAYKFVFGRPDNFPPGPPRLPFWGSYWFMLFENYKNPHLSLEKLAKRYKTDVLGFYLGSNPAVVAISNEKCKELLTKDEFIGRNDTIISRTRGLGEMRGMLFIDGPLWKDERRFGLRHLRDFGFGRRSQEVENFTAEQINYLVELMSCEESREKDVWRRSGEVLMPDVLYGPLLNSILSILCSTKFDNFKLREVARAGLRFQRSGDATGTAISMTPWLRFLAPDFFGYSSAVHDNGYMFDFLKQVIDEHLATFSSDHHRDFIDVYIHHHQDDLDYEQLLLEVLDFMFPTAIAIGHTLSFYFAHLINNPHVQSTIQKEIDNVVGRARCPNLDDRKLMPYLEATVRETMRIFPLNPLGVARRCMEDTMWGEYFIPSNTIMLPNVWSAHRDTQIWENPSAFSPERFLDHDGNLLKKDYTMGFGAGKRVCAGETFARQTIFLIASTFLQHFNFETPSKMPVDLDLQSLVPGANISPREYWIKATPR